MRLVPLNRDDYGPCDAETPRLMAENGLPALMKAAKRFKTHGKGAEVSLRVSGHISQSV